VDGLTKLLGSILIMVCAPAPSIIGSNVIGSERVAYSPLLSFVCLVSCF
jgi:hypothetical protein